MNVKKCNILSLLIAIVMVILAGSCKKYFDPPLIFEPDPGPNLTKDRKVLLISIDGLSGLELYNYVPTNISKLLENAKYTFEGIADANTRDAASWTTMLSGKSSGKHGIHGNGFNDDEDDEDDDDIHDHSGSGESIGYVTVYQRLLETGRALKSLSVTPWGELDQYMFNLSDENGVVASDEVAKDKAVDRIKNGEDNLTFAVINFRDLNAAGISGGFSMDNADYKATLDRIDGYIGEIVEAISQRKRSANEDWLVIITSNHGGVGNSYGGGSFEERAVPIIYYQPDFVEQHFTIPPSTTGFMANSTTYGNMLADDAALYNIGTTGEYTIQLKMLLHQAGTLNGAIMSKVDNTGNSPNGWSFIHNNPTDGWRLKLQGTQITSSVPFVLGKWYTLTARIYMDGTTRKAQVFTDGQIGSDGSLGTAQGSSNLPLSVGYGYTSYSNNAAVRTVRDLRIYNTAIPISFIQETYCQTIPYEEDPYKDNLIGYWSLGDGLGSKLKNSVPNAPDFNLNGGSSWEFIQNDFCKLLTGEEEEDTKNERFLYHIDIVPQIFYWLNIETHDSWGLEGSVFLNKFEIEFIGK